MTADENREPGDEGQEQKKAPYKLSRWEDAFAILVGIVLAKLLANWLFGPA